MVLVMDPFGKANDIRYGCRLFFNGGFFIVIGDKIDVIAYGGGGSPEEEPVNPPSDGVSVLLY